MNTQQQMSKSFIVGQFETEGLPKTIQDAAKRVEKYMRGIEKEVLDIAKQHDHGFVVAKADNTLEYKERLSEGDIPIYEIGNGFLYHFNATRWSHVLREYYNNPSSLGEMFLQMINNGYFKLDNAWPDTRSAKIFRDSLEHYSSPYLFFSDDGTMLAYEVTIIHRKNGKWAIYDPLTGMWAEGDNIPIALDRLINAEENLGWEVKGVHVVGVRQNNGWTFSYVENWEKNSDVVSTVAGAAMFAPYPYLRVGGAVVNIGDDMIKTGIAMIYGHPPEKDALISMGGIAAKSAAAAVGFSRIGGSGGSMLFSLPAIGLDKFRIGYLHSRKGGSENIFWAGLIGNISLQYISSQNPAEIPCTTRLFSLPDDKNLPFNTAVVDLHNIVYFYKGDEIIATGKLNLGEEPSITDIHILNESVQTDALENKLDNFLKNATLPKPSSNIPKVIKSSIPLTKEERDDILGWYRQNVKSLPPNVNKVIIEVGEGFDSNANGGGINLNGKLIHIKIKKANSTFDITSTIAIYYMGALTLLILGENAGKFSREQEMKYQRNNLHVQTWGLNIYMER